MSEQKGHDPGPTELKGAGADEGVERKIDSSGGYEVLIDHSKLAELPLPPEMKEALLRLPERMSFDKPLILIVGENGSGKTTLAKAIVSARGDSLRAKYPSAKNFNIILDSEDPASTLASAIQTAEERETGDFAASFIEGPEVMSEIRRWANQQAHETEQYRAENLSGGSYSHRLSNRQLFEQTVEDLKSTLVGGMRHLAKSVDIIFDEPEQGLSPQRQLDLPRTLPDFIQSGDTMLVPTNNLALFLSDLPRIDLSKPERGIFCPSDFGERGSIEITTAEEAK